MYSPPSSSTWWLLGMTVNHDHVRIRCIDVGFHPVQGSVLKRMWSTPQKKQFLFKIDILTVDMDDEIICGTSVTSNNQIITRRFVCTREICEALVRYKSRRTKAFEEIDVPWHLLELRKKWRTRREETRRTQSFSNALPVPVLDIPSAPQTAPF